MRVVPSSSHLVSYGFWRITLTVCCTFGQCDQWRIWHGICPIPRTFPWTIVVDASVCYVFKWKVANVKSLICNKKQFYDYTPYRISWKSRHSQCSSHVNVAFSPTLTSVTLSILKAKLASVSMPVCSWSVMSGQRGRLHSNSSKVIWSQDEFE